MGLFGPSEPRNSDYAALLLDTGPRGNVRKSGLRALASCEDQLDLIRRQEGITQIAHDVTATFAHLLVLTTGGVWEVRSKKVEKHFTFPEIAETTLGSSGDRILLQVISHKANSDYLPHQPERFYHVMQCYVATPGAGNLMCAMIDSQLG